MTSTNATPRSLSLIAEWGTLVGAVFANRAAAFAAFQVDDIDHSGYWVSNNSHRVALIVVLPLAVGLVTWAASGRERRGGAARRGLRAAIGFALWSTFVTGAVAVGLNDDCWVGLLALGAAAIAILAPPANEPPS